MQVFLLEDNLSEAAFFSDCLSTSSRIVHHFDQPGEFFDALQRDRPALVVLDRMMPVMSGLSALRRVREVFGRHLPVIMLSCMDDAGTIVEALDAGADDYLLKPMTRKVLVARIEALLRRSTASEPNQHCLSHGPYALDLRTQSVTIDGAAVLLTPKEFDLVWLFFSNVDSFIPKGTLVNSIWGKRGEIAPHTVTQHVHVIRKKLRFSEFDYGLNAVYGSGYRLHSNVSVQRTGMSHRPPVKDMVPARQLEANVVISRQSLHP